MTKVINNHHKFKPTSATTETWYLFADGMHHTNDRVFKDSFVTDAGENPKAIPKVIDNTYLFYDEAAFNARRSKQCTGGYHVKLVEHLHSISGIPVSITDKPRLHFPGGTRSNYIGPVAMPDLGAPSCWKLTFAQK